MKVTGLLISIAIIVLLWLVSRLVGFEVSLLGSLGLTIGLTIVLNLMLGAIANRRRGRSGW